MSFDGTVLHAVCHSLNQQLTNGRIDRIYQHGKDEIIINIRNNRQKYKLLCSASGNYPRVHLTETQYENPLTPPAFCMLLRKHLEGTKILRFSQYKMDRILKMDVLSQDELGDIVEKSLIIEIMGKYSNIILINNTTKQIYDSIKRVNFTVSSVREILPGKIYTLDNISNKMNPLEEKNILTKLQNSAYQDSSLKNFLMSSYTGISPQLTLEICYRSQLNAKEIVKNLSFEEQKIFSHIFSDIFDKVKTNTYCPIKIFMDNEWKDFYSLDLLQYTEKETVSEINKLLDEFYLTRDKNERLKNQSQHLRRFLKNEIDKIKRKLSHQMDEYSEALNRDMYKIYADLISSNLCRIKKGETKLEVENFYDNMNLITIPLDEKLDGSQNATRYYKKFSKLKNAAARLKDQMEQAKDTLHYLEAVEYSISLADSSSDMEEIREDLQSSGFLISRKKSKSKKQNSVHFHHWETVDGFHIYVGKNNRQNEYLTLKFARKDDLWFHVKAGAGSHVILQNNGKHFSEDAILSAAMLAAKFSSYQQLDNVEVDFTQRQNIKRHPSKKTGLVVYENFSTIHVRQNEQILHSLKKIED